MGGSGHSQSQPQRVLEQSKVKYSKRQNSSGIVPDMFVPIAPNSNREAEVAKFAISVGTVPEINGLSGNHRLHRLVQRPSSINGQHV